MSIAPSNMRRGFPFVISLTPHWLPDERRQGCRLRHRQYFSCSLVSLDSRVVTELRFPEQLRGLHPQNWAYRGMFLRNRRLNSMVLTER
jgi:hypothetical protein